MPAPRGAAARRWGRVVPPGAVSAAANAAAVANRSAGSFCQRGQHRVLDVRRDASRAAAMSGAGFSVITLATIACAVGPVNGGSPASISYATQPSA